MGYALNCPARRKLGPLLHSGPWAPPALQSSPGPGGPAADSALECDCPAIKGNGNGVTAELRGLPSLASIACRLAAWRRTQSLRPCARDAVESRYGNMGFCAAASVATATHVAYLPGLVSVCFPSLQISIAYAVREGEAITAGHGTRLGGLLARRDPPHGVRTSIVKRGELDGEQACVNVTGGKHSMPTGVQLLHYCAPVATNGGAARYDVLGGLEHSPNFGPGDTDHPRWAHPVGRCSGVAVLVDGDKCPSRSRGDGIWPVDQGAVCVDGSLQRVICWPNGPIKGLNAAGRRRHTWHHRSQGTGQPR